MYCLDKLGFLDCYYLDEYKVFNTKINAYMKEVGEYRYRLITTEKIAKSITIKEIYKRLFNEVFCIDEVERLDGEVFKPIEGTGNNYFISNRGRVLSYVSNYAMILKPTITKNGYERLQIVIDGQRYNKFVHCLVAAAWLGQPQSLEYEIHHKDFNQRNNDYTNLLYVSKQEHRKIHSERNKEQCHFTTVIQTKEV